MQRRVFVLDAEAGSRAALSGLLARRGFSVRAAGDWGDAAGTLAAEPWDLFMADPAPAACDFTGVILDLHARFPALPIILITSFARHEREIQRVRPVCRHIFEKPVDVGAVDRVLADVFAA